MGGPSSPPLPSEPWQPEQRFSKTLRPTAMLSWAKAAPTVMQKMTSFFTNLNLTRSPAGGLHHNMSNE